MPDQAIRGGMTFTSFQFGIFVAVVFGAYYLPPLRRFQVQLLVLASLVFYGSGQPELLPLLLLAVLGTYLCLVLAFDNRAVWMPAGIVFNLALLAFFKYKLLFIDPGAVHPTGVAPLDMLLRLPLPIGISFFVFHNISLLVDLTREKQPPPLAGGVPLHHLLPAAGVRADHPRGAVHAADRAQAALRRRLRCGGQMDPDRLLLQALRREQSQRDDVLYGLSALRDRGDAGPLAARVPVQLPDLC